MAALSEAAVIKSKPIREGLTAFRYTFRATCTDLGVPDSVDDV
jgi:hypothetical protein